MTKFKEEYEQDGCACNECMGVRRRRLLGRDGSTHDMLVQSTCNKGEAAVCQHSTAASSKMAPDIRLPRLAVPELAGTAGQQATACPDSQVAYINHPGAAIYIRGSPRQPAPLAAQLLAAAMMCSMARYSKNRYTWHAGTCQFGSMSPYGSSIPASSIQCAS